MANEARHALLERAQPLDELSRLTTDAASGQGRLALVGGEAGVGKTAVLAKLGARTRSEAAARAGEILRTPGVGPDGK